MAEGDALIDGTVKLVARSRACVSAWSSALPCRELKQKLPSRTGHTGLFCREGLISYSGRHRPLLGPLLELALASNWQAHRFRLWFSKFAWRAS